MLAHGAVLRKNGLSATQVIALLEDYHHAGLPPSEVHIMDYASKLSATPPPSPRQTSTACTRTG